MRLLTPELLDLLPADDPRAQRSRRDLARINVVMMQHRDHGQGAWPVTHARACLPIWAAAMGGFCWVWRGG